LELCDLHEIAFGVIGVLVESKQIRVLEQVIPLMPRYTSADVS